MDNTLQFCFYLAKSGEGEELTQHDNVVVSQIVFVNQRELTHVEVVFQRNLSHVGYTPT